MAKRHLRLVSPSTVNNDESYQLINSTLVGSAFGTLMLAGIVYTTGLLSAHFNDKFNSWECLTLLEIRSHAEPIFTPP
jgi:hypothetical protein